MAEPDYSTISFGDTPTFGSVYAGGSFLDTKYSDIRPQHVLTGPGKLSGHWLSVDQQSDLVIDQFQPDNLEHADFPSSCFSQDWFRIVIRSETEQRFFSYLHAAYECFCIFGSDLDGDGLDEVIMEYGEGRRTFAYSRKLEICKAGPSHKLGVFETALNGHIGGAPLDGRPLSDPDTWERRYIFTDVDKDSNYDIILYLVPPRTLPHYLGDTEYAGVLQFPKLIYGYNDKLRTYELRNFVLRKLENNNGQKLF